MSGPPQVRDALPDDALQGWLTQAQTGLVLSEDGELELWVLLDVDVATADGPESFRLALRPLAGADPYVFAADLQGTADAIVRQAGRELQASEQAMAEHRRQQRLEARRVRERATEAALVASTCDFCQRPVSFVVEGARLCKRHAEELGVRPHGKVGEPEPGELPEEEVDE